MISRFYSTGVGVSIIVATMCAIIFGSVPASSQSSSCGVSPSSDWDEGENPGDYLSIDIPGSGGGELFGFDGRSGLRALDKDVSTEWSDGSWEGFPGIQVDNGSATAIELVLMPGKRYTFCIDFSSKGDVYLLTPSDMEMYEVDMLCEEEGWELICEEGALDAVPVEYRDLFTWIPFRDTHAYESVSYQEFSVAIDSSGSAWSFAGFGSSSTDQEFFLVLDGWDNSRQGDQPASGNMSVEVLIDVEDRFMLPKTTAYVLIGSLPLSCIIIPLIIHSKYHSTALGKEDSGMIEVPFLNDDSSV